MVPTREQLSRTSRAKLELPYPTTAREATMGEENLPRARKATRRRDSRA